MAEAEFEDKLGDKTRVQFLEDLKHALQSEIPPTAWACLWLSDLPCLKEIAEQARHFPPGMLAVFRNMETNVKVVQTWTQRIRSSNTNSSTRSRSSRELCLRRDEEACIITKAGYPTEVAHIFPFSMREEHDRKPLSFWNILAMFWSKERVEAWYGAIFTSGSTEVCQNLLCLSPQAHAYWSRSYFALKPICLSDDKKSLDVQLFWLAGNKGLTQVDVQQVPSLGAVKDGGPNLSKLWDHKTDEKICSGRQFSLTTNDPETQPLPDVRLLDMQWILHRVAAISGAAKVWDFDNDPEEDGESGHDMLEADESMQQDNNSTL